MHVRNLLILAAASTSTVQASSWFGRFFGWAPAASQPAPQTATPAIAQPVVPSVVSTPVHVQPEAPAQPAIIAPVHTQPPVYVHVHVQPQPTEAPTPVIAKSNAPVRNENESMESYNFRVTAFNANEARNRQRKIAKEHRRNGNDLAAKNAIAIGQSHQQVVNAAESSLVTISKTADSAMVVDIAAKTHDVIREQTQVMKEALNGKTAESVKNDLQEFEDASNLGANLLTQMSQIHSRIIGFNPINDPAVQAEFDELSSEEDENVKTMSKQEKKELKAKKLAKKEKKAAKAAKKQEKKAKKQMEQLANMKDVRMEKFEMDLLTRLVKTRDNESSQKRKTPDSEQELPPAKVQKN